MKAQSTETSKMFFVIPRAVQSLSWYPLISCHFPKASIKFPPWSESNKSPRRELAVLMKNPEVKIRSGHLSPLPVPAPRAAGWTWAPRGGRWLSSPEWEPVQCSGVLVIVLDVVGFTLWAFLLLFCPHRNGCGCFVCVWLYTSQSFSCKSTVTANRSIVWNNSAVTLILLSCQDFVFNFSKEAFLCHMWIYCCFAQLYNRDSPVFKNPAIW